MIISHALQLNRFLHFIPKVTVSNSLRLVVEQILTVVNPDLNNCFLKSIVIFHIL
jgi:hypothetical protein